MNEFVLAAFLAFGSLHAFEKLDPKYQIQYGNPAADVKVVEYFSLSCPKCYEFFERDFPDIQEKLLVSKKAAFIFHPDPADLLTLQAMVCLEQLPEEKRKLFFEVILKHLPKESPKNGCLVLQAAMEALNHPVPRLADIDFLEKTEAFNHAYLFLKQTDVLQTIPMVEINGILRAEYPTAEFLTREIETLSHQRCS